MSKLLRALLRYSPDILVIWVYPWIAKPMLLEFGRDGQPSASFMAARLQESFSSPPTQVSASSTPEQAFAFSLAGALSDYTGTVLSARDVAPLLVAIGGRALADPDLQPTG